MACYAAQSSSPIKLRFSNYGSATTLQQPRLSNQNSLSLQQPPFSNQNSLASATKPQQPKLSTCGKYMHRHILHVISKSHPLWQVHAKSHLTRHIKIPSLLASTCKVTSYTSYQNPTPFGKYMQSHILRLLYES